MQFSFLAVSARIAGQGSSLSATRHVISELEGVGRTQSLPSSGRPLGANCPVVLALDAEGGDYAPREAVAGALDVASPELRVVLVGRPEIVSPLLAAASGDAARYVEVEPSRSVITFDDEPAWAVRNKPDSSIVIGAKLVAAKKVDGFVSAGNTGAMQAAGLLVVKRVRGVKRPAILVVLPGARGPVVLLDAGANAECRPEYLFQFALMGAAFARVVLGLPDPKVGLLNIGGESGKGSELAVQAHRLLAVAPVSFIGNVEGAGMLYNQADVVVTDGFTGNVVLKVLEGATKFMADGVQAAARSTFRAKAGGLLLRPALRNMLQDLDPEKYGGTYLLGVRGLIVICHGSSSRRAIANALRFAAQAVRGGLVEILPRTLESVLCDSNGGVS